MVSSLLGKDKVAMVGKTSKDPYGLWKPPIEALKKSGVNMDNVKIEKHICVPEVQNDSVKDETGCGQQTIAALSAFLTAAEIGILAGTLQFAKQGITPITKQELERYS